MRTFVHAGFRSCPPGGVRVRRPPPANGSTRGEGTGSPTPPSRASPSRISSGSTRASRSSNALKANKIQGLVVQNPLRDGRAGRQDARGPPGEKEGQASIDTGETLVTPENLSDPKIAALFNPPKEENVSGGNLSGGRKKKWRVIVIPKGTTHEFWKTIHAGAKKAATTWERST